MAPGEIIRALLDSIAGTVGWLGVIWLLSKSGVVAVNSGFPWVVFAPVVIGLFHGFVYGLVSTLLSMGGLGLVWSMPGTIQAGAFPVEQALAVFLLGLLSGEFGQRWKQHRRSLNARLDHCTQQLDALGRAYRLLQASHVLQQKQSINRAADLRSALTQMHRFVAESAASGTDPQPQVAADLLRLLQLHCQVQTAAVYAMEGTRLETDALARIGGEIPLKKSDRLVSAVLRDGAAIHLNPRAPLPAADGALAVIPLSDVKQRIWGLVVIHDMPFSAMEQDNLALISFMAGHVGDALAQWAAFGSRSLERETFLQRLDCSLSHLTTTGIPVAILARPLPAGYKSATASRCIDLDWICLTRSGRTMLVKLLPLTHKDGAKALAQRLADKVEGFRGHHSCDARESPASESETTIRELYMGETVAQVLAELAQACDLTPEDLLLMQRAVTTISAPEHDHV
jgi:hypothetical protein